MHMPFSLQISVNPYNFYPILQKFLHFPTNTYKTLTNPYKSLRVLTSRYNLNSLQIVGNPWKCMQILRHPYTSLEFRYELKMLFFHVFYNENEQHVNISYIFVDSCTYGFFFAHTPLKRLVVGICNSVSRQYKICMKI